MRISTSQIYDQNIRSIMNNQEDLVKTQQQLATGKRIITPSDDPVGAAKVLRLTEEIDELEQFQRNNDLVTGSLEQQEAVLTNITNSINRARTLVVQAGSGILSDPDKRAIGAELEQIKLEIFDLMNTQDADGNYLYAGYQSANQAFTYNPAATGNAISFSGDAGVSFIQLSNSSTIQSTSNGYEVFENVLSRFKFSVTGDTVANLSNPNVSEQGTFDTFFNKNYDPVTSANNDYQIT
ncbi:MAG TPA: flagellar hook-associated protein 3, partial [Alteromonas macleodii]|nr:flagellar hook-associated protein 3 [Alteromonas macleodii]